MSSNLGAVTRTGFFPHKAQQVENNSFVSIQNSTSRSTRERTAESFSREKLRQAPQKEGGEILCDLPPVWSQM